MNRTPLLLETIRIENGRPCHLEWHNRRFNRSRRELFGAKEELDLADLLKGAPPRGLYRCRVLYGSSVEKIEYLPYRPALPGRFALAEFPGEYRYKYADRSRFARLMERFSGADDLMLCRDGLLTDTSIANIALRRGGIWYTPRVPLLPGTTRARLLARGALVEAEISREEIGTYDELALMNAMIGFAVIENPIYIM